MNRRGSLLWIIFLLAAMFLGPMVFLNRFVASSAPRPELRVLIEHERLFDAPAPLPAPPADH